MPPTSLTPILPPRKIHFRARGERTWKVHTFSILGKKPYFDVARSTMPMKLTLKTDVDGFSSIDILGMNLFSALASAFLSVESILLMLRKSGEVRMRRSLPFDVEADALFFSRRVQALRRSLVSGRAGKKQSPTAAKKKR